MIRANESGVRLCPREDKKEYFNIVDVWNVFALPKLFVRQGLRCRHWNFFDLIVSERRRERRAGKVAFEGERKQFSLVQRKYHSLLCGQPDSVEVIVLASQESTGKLRRRKKERASVRVCLA